MTAEIARTPKVLRNGRNRHRIDSSTAKVAVPKVDAAPSPTPLDNSRTKAMLYLRPQRYAESLLQFFAFDAEYVENLRSGDAETQEHFVWYFSTLLQLKIRSKLQSPQAIEDVRQETFMRVLKVLRKEGGLRQPERLGAFVNTVCNNVLFEYYRSSPRADSSLGATHHSIDEEGQPELPSTGPDALDVVTANQTKAKVREILMTMPRRDAELLEEVFLKESERDEICEKFGVDREYLRVLIYRAKQDFKVAYLKSAQVRKRPGAASLGI